MSKITLFAQIIGKLDSGKFKKLVAKHQTDKQHLVHECICKVLFENRGLAHDSRHVLAVTNFYTN